MKTDDKDREGGDSHGAIGAKLMVRAQGQEGVRHRRG